MFPAGQLLESGRGRARFRYLDSYLEMEGAAPISVSLPLQEQAFDEDRTKTFLKGSFRKGLPEEPLPPD
jgi:HipA-like protein